MVILSRNMQTPLLLALSAVPSSHSVPLWTVSVPFVTPSAQLVNIGAGPRPLQTLIADRFGLWIRTQLDTGKRLTAAPEQALASA
jgi:hypothetical protein